MEKREAQPLKCDSGWGPGGERYVAEVIAGFQECRVSDHGIVVGHGYVVDGRIGRHYSPTVAIVWSDSLDQYGLDRAVRYSPEIVWAAVDACLVDGVGGECLGSVHDQGVLEFC